MLAVCGADHSPPLGGADINIPFTEDETRRHFHASLLLLRIVFLNAALNPRVPWVMKLDGKADGGDWMHHVTAGESANSYRLRQKWALLWHAGYLIRSCQRSPASHSDTTMAAHTMQSDLQDVHTNTLMIIPSATAHRGPKQSLYVSNIHSFEEIKYR